MAQAVYELMWSLCADIFLFFFQAEDGIRDDLVTGVQTCALPICEVADLNAGHLAAQVVDPSGNPAGKPHTIEFELAGLPAITRDARVREAVSRLLGLARDNGCAAIAIENLNFTDARQHGRAHVSRHPSRAAARRRLR